MELDRIKSEIKKRHARRILLQFPEGLINSALKISKELESETGVETFISVDPCWGGCDLAENEALKFRADLLAHFGHSPWPKKPKIPTLFIEARSDVEIKDVVLKAANLLNARKVGLATTVQHAHKLDDVKNLLEEIGFKILIGKPSGKAKYAGQILGCDLSSVSNLDVDQFLFIGGGTFHPLGIALATGKIVIAADPYSGKVINLEEMIKRLLMQRYAHIVKARDATRFGVVIGSKFGQINLELARKIRNKIESKGREAYLIVADEITPERFYGLEDIEVLIITACPRIVIEEGPQFRIPVITPRELNVLLGFESWESASKDLLQYKL
ncbi:MAG: diphthamide biosynthesis enzyme Dph2 [Candidatus Jordarchaeum sp.]|uniref:diphthamide biosynthesis enzyme Dph2 n=1 Tax=Candidatus Jordarchaeum sp. TaxID=2823881 RepID=UPI00404B6989